MLIVDTQALVWQLEGNPKLSLAAHTVLQDDSETKVISAISLFEVKHLHDRGRIKVSAQEALEDIKRVAGVIFPVGPVLLDLLPKGMELHDGIIVATGLYLARTNPSVAIVTKDEQITAAGLLPVIW